MRRSVPVLGAALTVLALAVPSAWGQSATDSTATGQVGSTDISAPVRVASDGDNQAASSAGVAGNQSVDSSSGAGQIGLQSVDAPVRVLSDGDDAAPEAGGGSEPAESDQPDDGDGSGPAEVVEQIVVAATGGIGRLVGRSAAAAADALRSVRAATSRVRGVASSFEDSSSPGGGTAGTPGGLREPPGAGDLTTALDVGSGGAGLPAGAGVRPAALFAAGALPLTGLSSWLLFAAGGWLLGVGLALLFTLSWFNAGRKLDARLPHPLSGRRFVR